MTATLSRADNPYITAKRGQYEAVRASITALQTRAAGESRDLTADELKSIEGQVATSTAIADEIQLLAAVEERNMLVDATVNRVLTGVEGESHNRADQGNGTEHDRALSLGTGGRMTGRTTTQDRDPGHYRSVVKGGKNSFFGDIYQAGTNQSPEAATRLAEHTRAAGLTTGANGPGVVPPHWLTEEFELLTRQERAVANAVRNIPLGDDPRPLTLPKQITGTDAAVQPQTLENDPLTSADNWDSDVDIVVPKPTAGQQIVSRQLLDMSDPAVDQLIYGDLISVYNNKIETKVAAALLAAATNSSTIANEAAFIAAAGGAVDSIIDAQTLVWSQRFAPADTVVTSIPRFGKFRKLKDGNNRPLMPFGDYPGPQNVVGISRLMTGDLEGNTVIPTAGMGTGTYPEKYLVIRAFDTILFESNMLRFRFEEVVGPQSVKLGIWAYSAVIVRQGGRSTASVTVTAA